MDHHSFHYLLYLTPFAALKWASNFVVFVGHSLDYIGHSSHVCHGNAWHSAVQSRFSYHCSCTDLRTHLMNEPESARNCRIVVHVAGVADVVADMNAVALVAVGGFGAVVNVEGIASEAVAVDIVAGGAVALAEAVEAVVVVALAEDVAAVEVVGAAGVVGAVEAAVAVAAGEAVGAVEAVVAAEAAAALIVAVGDVELVAVADVVEMRMYFVAD